MNTCAILERELFHTEKQKGFTKELSILKAEELYNFPPTTHKKQAYFSFVGENKQNCWRQMYLISGSLVDKIRIKQSFLSIFLLYKLGELE